MSCLNNTTDVKFQSTLFYTKSLFSVQDSLALLLVNCTTEHKYVKGNPQLHGVDIL